jgi:hypothetical protein
MVKVNAPAFSLDASGSLANAITFSKWKGRNYVRSLVRPSNPKSVLQVAVRSMMKFLAQNWASMTAPEQADWLDLAKATSISNFNAFVAANMTRWRQMHAPSTYTPATEAGTQAACAAATAVGGYHQAVVTFNVAGVNDGWGIAIERNTVDVYKGTIAAIVGVIPTPAAEAIEWTDTPLTAGTYYYYWRRFTRFGKLDGPFAQGSLSAVVT